MFALTFLINKKRVNRIGFKEQFIMAYGGLRGAVGFSLVTILPDEHPLKDVFLLATIVVIFFTVFIQGGTIKFFVSKLRIARKSEEAKSMSKDIGDLTMDHVISGIESVTGLHSQHFVIGKITNFDERFIKKYLIRDERGQSITFSYPEPKSTKPINSKFGSLFSFITTGKWSYFSLYHSFWQGFSLNCPKFRLRSRSL